MEDANKEVVELVKQLKEAIEVVIILSGEEGWHDIDTFENEEKAKKFIEKHKDK